MELYKIKWIRFFLPDDIRKMSEIKSIKLINLGSSAAKNDYKFEDKSALNAAMAPQSISYDVKLLKHFSKYMKAGSAVNCNIMPCSLLVDEYSNWNNHLKYCYILPKSEVLMFSRKMLFKAILKPIYRSLRSLKNKNETNRSVCLEKHAMERVNGWKKEFKIESLSDVLKQNHFQIIIQKNIDRLIEISEFCKTNEYKFIITLLPVSNELKKYIPSEYYSKLICQSVNKLGASIVIDYYHDNIWCDDARYNECDSLNNSYSCLFTLDYIERISNYDRKVVKNIIE